MALVYCYVLLCIIVYCCVLLCIVVYWCVLLCIIVYCCVLLCIIVYCCVLLLYFPVLWLAMFRLERDCEQRFTLWGLAWRNMSAVGVRFKPSTFSSLSFPRPQMAYNPYILWHPLASRPTPLVWWAPWVKISNMMNAESPQLTWSSSPIVLCWLIFCQNSWKMQKSKIEMCQSCHELPLVEIGYQISPKL